MGGEIFFLLAFLPFSYTRTAQYSTQHITTATRREMDVSVSLSFDSYPDGISFFFGPFFFPMRGKQITK
jgi:fumarylacetoacetate (FAA) hydrolase family protein